MVESAAQVGYKPEPHVTPLDAAQYNCRCIICTYLSIEEAQQGCYAVGIFHLHHNHHMCSLSLTKMPLRDS